MPTRKNASSLRSSIVCLASSESFGSSVAVKSRMLLSILVSVPFEKPMMASSASCPTRSGDTAVVRPGLNGTKLFP